MQTTAEVAGLTIETELVFGQLYVEGDLFALNRVYRNLHHQCLAGHAAAEAASSSARTAMASTRSVEIADTGCGIPKERLDTIFDDFVTTKRRGLGLGLAISKKIVEQLGGTISVASEVGVGTTFTIRFPLTQARPTTKLAARVKNKPGAERAGSGDASRLGTAPRLLLRENRVLQLLRDTGLDDRFRGNLDRLARCRVPAHPRLPFLHDELDHTGKHELAGSFQLLLRQRGQLVEELTCLRTLHLKAIGEM